MLLPEHMKSTFFLAGVFLAILVACVGAFTQSIYTGAGVSSDLVFAGASGVPLTYSARTDTCETGAETGCVANALCPTCTGTGQPLTYLARTADVVPKAGGGSGTNGQYLNGINTIVTDPD